MCSFSEQMIKIRKSKRISQEQLAKQSGISQSAISFIETGQNSPTIFTAQKIADALGVPLVELITGSPAPPAAPVVYTDVVLTETERQLVSDFRTLNKQGREIILQQMFMVKKISEEYTSISGVVNQ